VYLQQRGFDVGELACRWNLTYCQGDNDAKPRLRQCRSIPLYDKDDAAAAGAEPGRGSRLVGWQARTFAPTNKMKYLTSAGTRKSYLLYGFTQVDDGGPVVLVEGPTDVWRLGRDAVAILGKSLSRQQRQKLLEIADGRPIVVALDRDAATEARQIREQLITDRQQSGDGSPVVLVNLPDGRKDIGDCTRDEAWLAVARALRTTAGRSVMQCRTPSGVDFDVVNDPRTRLNATTLQRIGGSVVVVYGDPASKNGNMPVAVIGEDHRVRLVASGGTRILGQLRDRKRIYSNSIQAGLLERQQQLPETTDFEDLHIIAHLTGGPILPEPISPPRTNAPADGKRLTHTELVDQAHMVRQAWDNGDLLKRLDDQGQLFVYEHVEKPIVGATVAMIDAGMRIDVPKLEQLIDRAKLLADRYQRKIDKAAGAHVNLASPKALAELYEQLKLPVLLRNRDGLASTSTNRLRQLVKSHPIAGQIIAFRESHAMHQHGLRLRRAVRADTGRIHCQLDPLGTATGRFTCTSPNMLAISSELRAAFTAAPEHDFIELDASQIELRVLAHVTQSPELLQAFQSEVDLHRLTAAHVFGRQPQRVSEAQRSIGKKVNYAIVYGQTAAGLAAQLGVTRDDAQVYIDGFFRAYSGGATWIEKTRQEAREKGYVRTLYGRRRLLTDVNSGDQGAERRTLRQAVNTVIQGTAADIHKLTIARVFAGLPGDCRLLLAVHDSVLIEIPKGHRQKLTKQFRSAMQQAPPDFTVPIAVTVGYGRNWGECASSKLTSNHDVSKRLTHVNKY